MGALARSPQGIYQQANAGKCRSLDQRKVKAALAATETKPLDRALIKQADIAMYRAKANQSSRENSESAS